jgi:hypothetical protein
MTAEIEPMTGTIAGGCACGAVRYEAGIPVLMMNRHCRDCQRASGGPYAPFVVVPRASVQLNGELRYFDRAGSSGNRVNRGFCPECGSPVAVHVGVAPDVLALYAGSLDDPSMHRPSMDIFTGSAQPWDHMSSQTQKLAGGLR